MQRYNPQFWKDNDAIMNKKAAPTNVEAALSEENNAKTINLSSAQS